MVCASDPVLLLVSRYAESTGARVGLDQFIVRDLTARRGIDGPQIILSWEPPTDPDSIVTLIRITRKLYDFSVNEDDGVIVFEGPLSTTSYADCEDVPENKCVYYTIWSYRSDADEWVATPAVQINIVALITGDDHWRKLFTFMGENIIVGDKDLEHNMDAKIPLDLKLAEDGECFNIHEIGEEKGPLARFYKIFGAILDESRELIRDIPNQRNPNEACYQYLDLIASLLGFEINRDLPINRRRFELKNRANILKIKGTLGSISSTVQSISGFQTTAKDWCNNLFITNQSKTLSTDILEWKALGTADDFSSYTPGVPDGPRACNTVSIYIDLESSKNCLSSNIINKVNRSVDELLPVCVSPDICWNDETYREDIDLPTESFNSDIEDSYSEEIIGSHCWIITNDLTQGVTNSRFITAYPFGVCGEEWYDIIEDELLVSSYSDELTDTPIP